VTTTGTTTTGTTTTGTTTTGTTAAAAAERSTTRKLLGFAQHYAEMVVAMLVGMVALAPLWPAEWVARPDVHAVVMATDMTVVMALWMAVRRHSRPRVAEMSAAMYLPFLALLVPYWTGLISGTALMVAGHVVMFPLMLLAMVWRRAEYWH
jgi:hypothetical protein